MLVKTNGINMALLNVNDPRIFNFFHKTLKEQLKRNQENADDDGD